MPTDNLDPRLGEQFISITKADDVKNKSFVLLGYPDDEGVKINGGRVGAKDGPDEIRKHLFKMTPSLSAKKQSRSFYNLGNISLEGAIQDRHNTAKNLVYDLLSKNAKVVTMGGGHDYGYSDMAAFTLWCKQKKKTPFIINFDAHLDVRPDVNGPNSGTPFYRLLNEFSNLSFSEVGIQDWCNSKNHLEWAVKKKAKIITLEEIQTSKLSFEKLILNKCLKGFNAKKHELALSIDIDCFSSAYCPGASQVFPVGIDGQIFIKFFQNLLKKYDVKLIGLYELNPTYDQDHRTAKFAAITIHQFLYKSQI